MTMMTDVEAKLKSEAEAAKAALKGELNKYINDIKTLNAQLENIERQKNEILKVGTRLEGVVAYLRGKFSEAELMVIDGLAAAVPGPAATPTTPPTPSADVPATPAAEPVAAAAA